MSNRIGMTCKLVPQQNTKQFHFDKVNEDDINDLSCMMFEAFQGTADYEGETVDELRQELSSVILSTFGTFIPKASFQIKIDGEIAAVILISFYNGKPFVSELFTVKKYLKQGMGSALLKKSINSLIEEGYEDLVLYVHPQNESAVMLYKKLGFHEIADVSNNRSLEEAINLRKEGKAKESNELLLKLLEEHPNDPKLNYHCAWSFDALGLEHEAIPYYEHAISFGLTGEDLKGAYLGLGSTLRTIGEYEKSKEVFVKAIEDFPKDNALKTFYAMTLYNLGNNELCVEMLLHLLAETSSDTDIIAYKKAVNYYADKLDHTW